MEEMLSLLPETGFTEGEFDFEEGEQIATHPETWTPLVLAPRGRPRKGQEIKSTAKSFRLQDEVWILAEAKARRLNLPLHTAVRKVILDWAQTPEEAPVAVQSVAQISKHPRKASS
jgi:hypothetical protein